MITRSSPRIAVLLLVFAVMVAGCAKRPATTQASAPAPAGGGQVQSREGAPTTAAPPRAMAPQAPPATAAPQAPATTARPSPKEFMAVADLKDIHFDFDKYDIRPADAKVLDTNAAWLKSNANQLVLIEGHCDERGTNEYNLALGERRAKSTMNYLV